MLSLLMMTGLLAFVLCLAALTNSHEACTEQTSYFDITYRLFEKVIEIEHRNAKLDEKENKNEGLILSCQDQQKQLEKKLENLDEKNNGLTLIGEKMGTKLEVLEGHNRELMLAVEDHQKQIKQIVEALAHQKTVVAFEAYRAGSVTLSAGQTLVFNTVTRNTHNDYNPNTGKFVASINGNYLISSTVLSQSGKFVQLHFKKNENTIIGTFTTGNSKGFSAGSKTLAVDLKKGDSVCVKEWDGKTGHVQGTRETSFMGVLLTPYRLT